MLKIKIKNIIWILPFVMLLSSCRDTVKENNREAQIEDQTPVLKEQWKQNLNDWSETDDRSTIVTELSNHRDFNSFNKLLRTTDLYHQLDEIEEGTLFVPTNAAIAKISDAKLAHLKSPEGRAALTDILTYHLIPENEYDYIALESTVKLNEGIFRLKTLQGTYLSFIIRDHKVYVTDEMGNSTPIKTEKMEASNGVIHSIDALLIPQQEDSI